MKPILFNTEMTQAIMTGRKNTTRRVIKPKYSNTDLEMFTNKYGTRLVERQNDAPADGSKSAVDGTKHTICHLTAIEEVKPKYKRGELLYIRETWRIQAANRFQASAKIEFKAGGESQTIQFANGGNDGADRSDYDAFMEKWDNGQKWHPSIFMPKEAARIFLKITDVRTERLQDMSRDDAIHEGIDPTLKDIAPDLGYYRVWGAMQDIWDRTMTPADRVLYGWEASPWVWVYEFQQISKAEAQK